MWLLLPLYIKNVPLHTHLPVCTITYIYASMIPVKANLYTENLDTQLTGLLEEDFQFQAMMPKATISTTPTNDFQELHMFPAAVNNEYLVSPSLEASSSSSPSHSSSNSLLFYLSLHHCDSEIIPLKMNSIMENCISK